MGSYTDLIEQTVEGKTWRIAIPEEVLNKAVTTLQSLQPFLDNKYKDDNTNDRLA